MAEPPGQKKCGMLVVAVQSIVGSLVLLAFCCTLPVCYAVAFLWYKGYTVYRNRAVKGLNIHDKVHDLDRLKARRSRIVKGEMKNRASLYTTQQASVCSFTTKSAGTTMATSTSSNSSLDDRSFSLHLEEKMLSNNSNTYTMRATIKTISSEADIVEAIGWARRHNVSIRAMGSLFSWPEIVQPGDNTKDNQGIVLDLVDYRQTTKTLFLDEPEPDGTIALVTVQAGMKVWQLCDLLDDLGYAIPVLGNVTGQSVGGVISTGTHGKNPRYGSLSSLVQSMRLVLANGTVKNIALKKLDGKANTQDPLSRAAGVSMGLLGVVSTVTFRCVPKHRLAFSIQVLSFQTFLSCYDSLLRDNEHVAGVYFPFADVCRLELARRLTKDEEERQIPNKTMPSHNRTKLFFANVFNWFIFESKFSVWFTTVCWAIQRYFVANDSWFLATPNSPAVEKSYNVVANNVMFDVEHHEMEFAYDKSDTKAVLSAYRETLKSLPAHFQMSSILDIRFSAGEDSWMAASFERPSVWLDLIRPTVHADTDKFMEAFRPTILKFGGRTHFGKECVLSPEEIRQSFPMFDEFVALRRDLDPTGLFANPHYDEVFGACSLASAIITRNRSSARRRSSFAPSMESVQKRLLGSSIWKDMSMLEEEELALDDARHEVC